MVVPNGQLGYVRQDRLQARHFALALEFLGKDVRVQGVRVDIIPKPEKEVRIPLGKHLPDRLQRVPLPTGTGAVGNAEAALLAGTGCCLEVKRQPPVEILVNAVINPDRVVIHGIRVQPLYRNCQAVIRLLLGHENGRHAGVRQIGIRAVNELDRPFPRGPQPDEGGIFTHGPEHRSLHDTGITGNTLCLKKERNGPDRQERSNKGYRFHFASKFKGDGEHRHGIGP
jgi:hypothetical protein